MNNIRQCTTQLSRVLRSRQVLRKKYYHSTFKSSKSEDLNDAQAVAQEQKQDPVPEEEVESHQAEDSPNDEDAPEMVKMWNKDAVAGPEWNGPRGYEPTKFGDWSSKGRVTDF